MGETVGVTTIASSLFIMRAFASLVSSSTSKETSTMHYGIATPSTMNPRRDTVALSTLAMQMRALGNAIMIGTIVSTMMRAMNLVRKAPTVLGIAVRMVKMTRMAANPNLSRSQETRLFHRAGHFSTCEPLHSE